MAAKNVRTFRALSDLESLLEAEERYLRFGMFYRIYDYVMKLTRGDREKHPWVIVRPYAAGRPTVALCLRTTQGLDCVEYHELLIPKGLVPGLHKDGKICLTYRKTLTCAAVKEQEYLGQLPDDWIERLRKAVDRLPPRGDS